MTSFRQALSSIKNNLLLTKAKLETSSLGLPEIYGPVEIREICKAAKSIVLEIQKSTPQDQTADSTTQGTLHNLLFTSGQQLQKIFVLAARIAEKRGLQSP